jgi:pilus assembly protein Flp/PilA
MFHTIQRVVRSEDGATAVEYGLIVSLIVLAMFVGLKNVGDGTSNMWNKVSNKVVNAQ